MSSDLVLHPSDQSFDDDVIHSDLPVLLDFTATWCGPCKQIAPLIDQVAGDYQGRVRVAKVDVDQCPTTAMKYNVRAVPTLLLVRSGQVVAQRVGALSRSALDDFISQAL